MADEIMTVRINCETGEIVEHPQTAEDAAEAAAIAAEIAALEAESPVDPLAELAARVDALERRLA
jgi:hypothetical protein